MSNNVHSFPVTPHPAPRLPIAASITSKDIAELVGKRHDNVKRTIERLAKASAIRLPPTEDSENINNLGFVQKSSHYVFSGEIGKRDSIIVVAQLSPEFTARLVDRWLELEQQAALSAFNIPDTLHGALLLAADLAVAKVLGVGPNKLFQFLREEKMLMHNNLPYQHHIDAGHFRVVEKCFRDERGKRNTYTRTLVTGKGLAYIQKRLQSPLPLLAAA